MRSRYGHLYIFNGLNAPQRWDGQTTAAEKMGLSAPTGAVGTLSDDTGGGSLTPSKTYYGTYRYIDDEQPQPVPSSIAPLRSVTTSAAANHRLDWAGFTQPTESRVWAIELWRTTGNQADTLYQLSFSASGLGTRTSIGFGGSVTSSQDDGSGKVQFNLPSGHKLVVNATITVASHSVGGYNATHTITSVTATSVVTATAYTSSGTGGTWILAGYIDDGTSDTDLAENAALPIVHEAGTLSARRFTPPPDFKAVCVPFLDRYWLAVDRIYTKGTVATNGTTTVTGTGTDWPTTLAGRYLYINGETKPYLISSASGTSITLSEAAANTASGKSYAIRPAPVERGQIYYSEPDEPESWPAINVLPIPDSPDDDDEITGLMTTVSALYVLKERHMFRVTYVTQPQANPSVSIAASRGCLNQRCWIFHEGTAYLMDQAGVWRFSGQQGGESVSQPIQDLFRDGTIDFSKSKWFWAAKDPRLELAYFFYCTTSDTYPQHALVYHLRSGQWWTESYPFAFGHGSVINLSGAVRLASAGPNDKLYLLNHNTLDGLAGTGTTRGTVTSATSSTLVDSTATFPTDCAGTTVSIVDGTGEGQTRTISVRDSGTQVTVSSNWTTTPDTTSVYQIGAIAYTAKTGKFRFPRARGGKETGASLTSTFAMLFQPVTAAVKMILNLWYDRETSAQTMRASHAPMNNLEFTAGSADIELSLKKAVNARGDQNGWTKLELDSNRQDRSGAPRHLQVSLEGFQGAEEIAIYDLGLDGVEMPQ